MAEYRLSVDPGVNTGLCLWENDEPIWWEKISCPARKNCDFGDRLDLLRRSLPKLPITVIEAVIERPHKGTPRANMSSMFTSCYFAGVVIAWLGELGIPVREIQKPPGLCYWDGIKQTGKDASKKIAAEIAKTYGIEEASEHVNDAIMLGDLAGFGRNVHEKAKAPRASTPRRRRSNPRGEVRSKTKKTSKADQ